MNSNLFPAGNVNSHWAEKAKPTEEAIQGSPFEMITDLMFIDPLGEYVADSRKICDNKDIRPQL